MRAPPTPGASGHAWPLGGPGGSADITCPLAGLKRPYPDLQAPRGQLGHLYPSRPQTLEILTNFSSLLAAMLFKVINLNL